MIYSRHLFRHLRFTIGQNLIKNRLNNNISVPELAIISTVPADVIQNYETGKGEVHLNHLLKIACALKLEIKDFMA